MCQGTSDIWYEAETSDPGPGQRFLVPLAESQLAEVGMTTPGYAGCVSAALGTERIDLLDLPVGTFVCVETSEGRLSEVQITQAAPEPGQALGIAFRTFEGT